MCPAGLLHLIHINQWLHGEHENVGCSKRVPQYQRLLVLHCKCVTGATGTKMDLWLDGACAVASREAHIFPTFRAAPAIRTFYCAHFVSDPVFKIQPTIYPASQPVHQHHRRAVVIQ